MLTGKADGLECFWWELEMGPQMGLLTGLQLEVRPVVRDVGGMNRRPGNMRRAGQSEGMEASTDTDDLADRG